jgi:type II secretory pathway component PulF
MSPTARLGDTHRPASPRHQPISIKQQSTLFAKRAQKIQPADIAIFTRQLATMMKSGVPL